MREVYNIIDKIANTSSRNEKEEILKIHKNNQQLKNILKFVYDPFIITGISKKKINKDTIIVDRLGNDLNTVEQAIEYLKENNTGRDIDIARIQSFIYKHDNKLQDFYKQVFTKELTIGITAKTLNKVYGKNFINDFSVMLAEPFERFYNNVACEVKVDGCRCLTIKQNKSVNMFTRNGKLIEGFNDLIEQIKSLPVDTMVFDGELISKDYVGTMNNLFRKSEGKQSDYMIFDMLTLSEFQQGISNNDYWTRKQGLINLFKQVTNCPNLICVEPFKILKNATIEDINEATQIAMSMGFEGAMIKPLDSKYECKRSYAWQKAKIFQSDEFKIIDFEEGDGKYKGTLGKVVVDVNGVSVGVGSGFNDNQRNEIWSNKGQYLGKYLEVQFQEKIKKTGALRFPTVKSIRLDK